MFAVVLPITLLLIVTLPLFVFALIAAKEPAVDALVPDTSIAPKVLFCISIVLALVAYIPTTVAPVVVDAK